MQRNSLSNAGPVALAAIWALAHSVFAGEEALVASKAETQVPHQHAFILDAGEGEAIAYPAEDRHPLHGLTPEG